jgi:cytochrome c
MVLKSFVRNALLAMAALSVGGAAAAADPAGDPVKGKVVFAKCMICHTVQPGVNKLGPTLANIIGQTAGDVPGFTFSPAMKASKIVWSPATLDQYLTNPRKMVPGTKMIFAGLPNPVDRANVIAYLKTPTK